MDITIEYNGKYPNLCSGELIVHIADKTWNFGAALSTGGSVWIDSEFDGHVEEGPWTLTDYPDDFPEEYLEALLETINNTLPWGCCGGCI